MKVIVTGGAGFIGSNLVRLLLERGHEVLNIDALTYAGNIHSLDGLADSPAYRFLHADVRDSSLMSRTLREYGPDWVMHLAAESHVDRSIDDPGNFMTTNVMGTFSLPWNITAPWRGRKRSASASITFPRMRCTAPWERKACSRNPRRIAPIPRIPPARLPATTWCAPGTIRTGCPC